MKRILVTGSNGLLGQKLVDKLRERKDVTLLATSIGQDRHPAKGSYLYVDLDITDRMAVLRELDSFKPHVIINTAAMTNVDTCESQKEACAALNIKSVGYILEAAAKLQSQVIQLSTDFIFDGENGPYAEEHLPAPLSYYGYSKEESEKLVKSYAYSWAIIRTIIVYGVVKDMSRLNIVLWAKNALEQNKPINVVDDQFRSPTLAEDLADACISVALANRKGIYHVSGKDYMSILELVQRVADYYQFDKSLIAPIKSGSLAQAAKRPPRTGFILDKAIRELNYQPHTFEEGLNILDKQLRQLEKIEVKD